MEADRVAGPLAGTRIVDIGGIGPGPWASTLLADLGAEVLRLVRPDRADNTFGPRPQWVRGLAELELDLKHRASRHYALAIVDRCDVLIEGFRPGVAERLGLGPVECQDRNPRLVYARVTGWGQAGPYAMSAGHDINYIGTVGALDTLRSDGRPPRPPLYYLGDWASGAMLAALGVTSALIERQRSDRGQVVDAAIVDGVALMLGEVMAGAGDGTSAQDGETAFLCGDAWYGVFETADGAFMAVGAVEERFYRALLDVLGLTGLISVDRQDRAQWPVLHQQIAEVFKRRTQDEWSEIFACTDACVSPVRTLANAMADPHLVARRTFIEVDGRVEPAPAPRFDRTPAEVSPARDATEVLAGWGMRPPMTS